MAKFTIDITLGNDAMQEPTDVAEALNDIAKMLNEHGFSRGAVIDSNGDRVGRYAYED